MSPPTDTPLPLEAVLCTEQLFRRPRRAPDYETENRALAELAQALADAPGSILQRMVEILRAALGADSVGLSLLGQDGARLHWPAIAGEWEPHIGTSTPRDFGPCGAALDYDAPLLFTHPERRYRYLASLAPSMVEGLVVPIRVRGRPVGAVWAVAHTDRSRTDDHEFDAEDLRMLESLSRSVAAAYQATVLSPGAEEAERALAESHSRVSENMARAAAAASARSAALNLMEDAIQARQATETVNSDLRQSEALLTRQLLSMQELQSISSLLIEGSSDTESLHQRIVDAAALILRSQGASLQMLDEHADALRLLAFRGFDAAFGEAYEWVLPDMRSACSLARSLQERVLVPDVEAWDLVAGTTALETYRELGIRAVQSTPLLSRDGALLGMLSTHWCTVHTPATVDLRSFDVLVRQAADLLERIRAQDALRQSEARLRFMAESMPQKTFTANMDGEHQYLNQQWLEYAGLASHDVPDRGWEHLLHPDDLALTLRRWRNAVVTGAPFEIEHRCRRYDGESRWHLTRARAMRDPHDNVVLWIGSSTDVHDAKEADRRKDEFLAMLAHELRNPLAPVAHATHLLRDPGIDPAHAVLAVDVIGRQTKRMSRLIDDLLDVSRITRGKVELRRTRVDLRGVIETAIETQEVLIEQKRQQLGRPALTEPIWLLADAVRLEQVISNLLSNATRYTPEGGRIELVVEQEPDWILVRVRDTGIGIAPDTLPRIFDLFSQEAAGGRGEGLGIGLTVVRQLVQLHGGSVSATSAGRGQGTEIVVQLPYDPGLLFEAEPDRATSMAPRLWAPPQRVLVVEDNADAADLLSLLLESWGHEVHAVADGPAALAEAAALQPDLILLDLGLPGMSGYEVARELRRDPVLAETPIVAMTGYGQDEDRRRTRAAGFDEHLVKPVRPETLQELLARRAVV